ncbi:hypothetical protein [Thalassotalea sp. PS06]|uniref:hypothetical protein n=1 Tax=Thalassotalea sp. PS06 TaxID=2594005 RepID=UPI001161C796|nr:hypothetical protein [Thalassotalea sp. PS06]QDP01028.1 hypothetical protein FNC98_06515 [Thalassotalea sp. PS06]
MMRTMVLFTLLSCSVQANQPPLVVDRGISGGDIQLAFPNDENIVPQISDFGVLNNVLMSNEAGERWAVVTFTNLATGKRSLNQKHVMALLANGERIVPYEFSEDFEGGETLSLTLNFGENKFPLLQVYTRN